MKANDGEQEAVQFQEGQSRGALYKRRAFVIRATGYVVWCLFVLYCLGFAISRGLCCADDSYRALVAKNVCSGLGFATNWGTPGQVPAPVLFDPQIGDGSLIIISCTLLLKLAGMSEVVPGITAILLWSSVLTVLLVRISRQTDPSSFAWGVSMFSLSILAAFPAHFEHWYAFLGEVPAAAFLILGHWMLAAEKLSWRTLLLSGLALGLAVEAKYLALLGTVGACVILLVRFRSEGLSRKTWFSWGALFSLGCVIPTLAFETYKLSQLGVDGYLHHWRDLSTALSGWVIRPRNTPLLVFVSDRLALMRSRFMIDVAALIMLITFALYFAKGRLREKWFLFFAGLLVSVFALGFYWLMYSAGWPRYLVIAAAMAWFTLAVPLFGLVKSRRRLVYAALTCLLFVGGILRIPHLADVCDNGLFRASTDKVARAEIARRITALKQEGSILFAGRGWASFADVEFNLAGSANFNRIDAISSLPGRKVILINRHFSDENDEIIQQVRARTSEVLFSSGSYDLLEIQ